MAHDVHARYPTYVTVAASQTEALLSERAGTILHSITIQPATTGPGVVTIKDGKGTGTVTVLSFPGGASSAGDLLPQTINLGWICTNTAGTLTSQGWCVTTGANVSLVANVQIR